MDEEFKKFSFKGQPVDVKEGIKFVDFMDAFSTEQKLEIRALLKVLGGEE